ncbi:MAG TPA: PEP-CTERM sorting domain-containing protein, partial [Fimbriimonadaceae bacterium]|nr:PEP-CTERM sorting domain-containing protein [Fimbriimonadaceae bacterium]
ANQWNRLDVVYNFTSHTLTGSVNGVALGLTESFTSSSFGDADLYSPANGTTVGYFDDYNVTATAAPEPASLAMLGFGAFALLRRRRTAQ